MRAYLKHGAIGLAIFCAAIILLPTVVSAEVQTQVTENAIFQPYEDNYNEKVNIANSTIQFNRDTWDPLPEGIFVGGTVAESRMRLKEVGIANHNNLLLATVIKLDQSYVSNGASRFVVRLPVYIADNASQYPQDAQLYIYSISDVAGYSIRFNATGIPYVDTGGALVASAINLGNLFVRSLDPSALVWQDMSHESWVSEHRIYVRVIAPVLAGQCYLIATRLDYPIGTPFDIYWQGADLCSDNISQSNIAYSWNTAPDQVLERNYPIPADLGWSCVFQQGLGGLGITYDAWYDGNNTISWYKWVQVNGTNASGAFSFVMEFRVNYSSTLTYNLNVDALNPNGTIQATLLSSSYWHDKTAWNVIIAANPMNRTLTAWNVGGAYYVVLSISLQVRSQQRMQLMAVYEPSMPYNVSYPHNKFTIWTYHFPATMTYQTVFFAPYCTALIGPMYYNESAAPEFKTEKGFWSGVGAWWDRHWMDLAGIALVIAGAALIVTGVGAGFGAGLFAAGVTMLLYNNWGTFRNAVNGLVKAIIDGLTWLGNWLWKIGQWIWKALTWLVDQVVYYGAILLGLLIIGVAVLLFVGPLYAEIKILGAFLMMARGEYEKAAAQLSGLVSQAKGLVGR